MPDNADLRKYLTILITLVMFLAGFALADILLFKGSVMPASLRPLAGLLVCGASGVYAAILFNRANRK